MIPQVNAITRDDTGQVRSPEDVRKDLEARHGKVYTLAELREEFEVIGFMSPICVVRRLSDGRKGSFEFTHSPRLYFNWQEDK
jgi:hypothetical protein